MKEDKYVELKFNGEGGEPININHLINNLNVDINELSLDYLKYSDCYGGRRIIITDDIDFSKLDFKFKSKLTPHIDYIYKYLELVNIYPNCRYLLASFYEARNKINMEKVIQSYNHIPTKLIEFYNNRKFN